MAHKIGLVLLASLHLINGQIYGLRHDGDDHDVRLHQRVIVSKGADHRNHEDDSNEHKDINNVKIGFNILKNAHEVNSERGGDRHQDKSWGNKREDNSGKDRHEGKSWAGKRQEKSENRKQDKSWTGKREENSENRHENKSQVGKRQEKSDDDHKQRRENKSWEGKREEKSRGHKEERSEVRHEEKSEPEVQRIVIVKAPEHKELKFERKQQRSDRKERKSRKQESSIDVNKAINFHPLRYAENHSDEELEKAPITVVTVPIVASLDHDDGHRVARNEVVGKSNCPQCKDEDHQSHELNQKADKSLFKYDEKLKTEVKPLIKNVEVKSEEHEETSWEKEQKEQKRRDNKKKEKQEKKEKAQRAHLREELAEGERLEHAPLVIGKVIVQEEQSKPEEREHYKRGDNKWSNERREEKSRN